MYLSQPSVTALTLYLRGGLLAAVYHQRGITLGLVAETFAQMLEKLEDEDRAKLSRYSDAIEACFTMLAFPVVRQGESGPDAESGSDTSISTEWEWDSEEGSDEEGDDEEDDREEEEDNEDEDRDDVEGQPSHKRRNTARRNQLIDVKAEVDEEDAEEPEEQQHGELTT